MADYTSEENHALICEVEEKMRTCNRGPAMGTLESTLKEIYADKLEVIWPTTQPKK